MNCPACSTALQMTDRQGVEIDYCPKCRGVWLDRGELDKIIERASAGSAADPMRAASPGMPPRRHDDDDDDDDRRYPAQPGGYYPPKKRKSFLGEIFDF